MANRNSRPSPPKWLSNVVKEIQDSCRPYDDQHIGSFGYELEEPSRDHGWIIHAYVKANEMWGGPRDGAKQQPGVSFCVTQLSARAFDEPPHIDWHIPTGYKGYLDGPHLILKGKHRRHRVMVCLFDKAPKDVLPALKINAFTRQPIEEKS